MRVVRDFPFADARDRGACAAIGNFDGVHRGHQSVIAAARSEAARLDTALAIVTFEPHPRGFFDPDASPFRLMDARARARRLEMLGVDILYELPFNDTLAGLSADAFVARVLGRGLGLRHAVVGADFRFGKGRGGDVAMLKRLGPDAGFDVTAVPLIGDADTSVSSTAIRTALSDGRPDAARDMLGHWHRIEGPVIHGDQRGRMLGYPTANLSLAGLHVPRHGVYSVIVDVLTGPHIGRYNGVASIGVRPMFGENTPNLEVFLFDFSGDLYGAELSVALVAFQRGEEKFADIDALIAQMDRDSAQARATLAALPR